MAYNEDHIALAAEYALGTLDAGERDQVETMMAVDDQFAAVVISESETDHIIAIANVVRRAVSTPVAFGETEVPLTASIGLALCRDVSAAVADRRRHRLVDQAPASQRAGAGGTRRPQRGADVDRA